MIDERKVINVTDVGLIELIKGKCSNHHFGLKFYGFSPNGKQLLIKIDLEPYYLQTIAGHLHALIQQFEKELNSAKFAMKGNL